MKKTLLALAAVALLANSIATGAGLYVLITALAPVSGAHFNPVVTLAAWLEHRMTFASAVAYIAVQCLGAWIGNCSDLPTTPLWRLER